MKKIKTNVLKKLILDFHLRPMVLIYALVCIALIGGATTVIVIKSTASKKSLQISHKSTMTTVVHKQQKKVPTTSNSKPSAATPTSTPAVTPKAVSTTPAKVTPVSPPPPTTFSKSPVNGVNWTGYAVSGSTNEYTMVEGTVVVPTITCPSQTQAAQFSLWVGLDGYNDNTVEQEGIRANCDNYNCSGSYCPDYYTWTDMAPGNLINQSLAISPGDTVLMQVTYLPSSNEYQLYMQDESSGQSFTSDQPCSSGYTCLRNSAEWISENHLPSTLVSLFGSATFTNTLVASSGSPAPFTNYVNYPMDAYYSSQEIESVSYPLNIGATSFTINQLVND